jgi:hypothetical protein
LSTARAVADVAVCLVKQQDLSVIDELTTAMTQSKSQLERELSATAIAKLVNAKLLDARIVKHIAVWVEDSSLPEYSRRELIQSLRDLDGDALNDLWPAIIRVAEENGESEAQWSAVDLIIRQPDWSQWEPIIWRKVGWSVSSGELPGEKVDLNGWRAWLVGQMLVHDPKRFAKAAAYVLAKCDNNSSYQLARCLQRCSTIPTAVLDALVDRIDANIRPHYAETHLFRMLAKASAERFLSDDLASKWSSWPPESKVAFLLAHLQVDQTDAAVVSKSLSFMAGAIGDSSTQVRRTAYRCISCINCDALRDLCRDWSKSDSVDVRLRAAEALQWVPYELLKNESFLDTLMLDRVRLVRVVCDKSYQESRKTAWRRSYIERVKSVVTPDHQSLFAAYPYGEALIRLGDDVTLNDIQKHLNETPLPPNVFNWLKRICRDIEKKLQKDQSADEETLWYGWDAIIEQFDGKLKSGESEHDATFRLWRRPAAEPGELGDWQGVAIVPEFETFSMLGVSTTFQIAASNRKTATALFRTNVGHNVVVLTGSGPYPKWTYDTRICRFL